MLRRRYRRGARIRPDLATIGLVCALRWALGMKRNLLFLVCLLAACVGPPEEVEEAQSELNRAQPPVYQGNPMLLIKAVLNELIDAPAIPGQFFKTQCKACSFTTGKIINPGVDNEGPAGKDRLNSLLAWNPPELPGSKLSVVLQQAKTLATTTVLANANADNVKSTLGTLEDLFSVLPFADIDESVTETDPAPEPWVLAFRPIYGRHRKTDTSILATTNYPNPLLLDELTDRGARSYCAMREAARHSFIPNLPMLKHSLADVIWWSFGKTDADVTFMPTGKAYRFPQVPADVPGAQAFVIPLAIGATVAPLSGPFVPDFGTFQHAIAWITGDAEVLSLENKTGAPFYGAQYNRNIEHVDAFAGVTYHGGVGVKNVMLANFGLFQLSLFANMQVTIGELEDGDQVYDSDEDTTIPAGRRVLFDRWQGTHGLWAPPRWGLFDNPSSGVIDAAIATPICGEFSPEFPGYVGGGSGCNFVPVHFDPDDPGAWNPINSYITEPAWGTAARWRNDDDRQFALKDKMDLELGVTGSGGIDISILKIGVEASMSLDAHSSVETIVREGLSIVNRNTAALQPAPIGTRAEPGENPITLLQSNFTLTPVANDWVGITPLKAAITFHLGPIPFIGDIDWKLPIIDPDSINLAGTRIDTPERDRVRVGEYSEAINKTPVDSSGFPTFSHLPRLALGGNSKFAALPQNVAECLKDDTQVGHEPQPKPSKPAETEIPYGLCYYGPSMKAVDIFATAWGIVPTNIPVQPNPQTICEIAKDEDVLTAHYALTFGDPAQVHCMVQTTRYLCGWLNDTSAPNLSHWLHGYKGLLGAEDVIAHLIQPDVGEEQLTFAMWDACVEPFNVKNGDALSNFMGQMFTMTFVQVHICDKKTLQPVGLMPVCDDDPLTPDCFQIQPCVEDPITCECSPCPDGRCGPGDKPIEPYFCQIDPKTGECPVCEVTPVPLPNCAPPSDCEPDDPSHG